MTEKEYQEQITNLAIATAAIPEMKEDIKEVIRALKGNNGHLGVIARLAQAEKVLAHQAEEYDRIERSCALHRQETNQVINERFDRLFLKIEELNQQHSQREHENHDREDKQRFQIKRDWRAFIYGILLASVPDVIKWVVSHFS
jgi:hypothetical protein